MGMDYRYLLFFPHDARLAVLESLAELGDPASDDHVELCLPERTVDLPFRSWLETEARIAWDDSSPTWDFMTVLGFEPDEPLVGYLERMSVRMGSEGEGGESLLDSRGLARIGIVYLSVHHDMTDWPSDTGEDLVLFELGTPGSSMSVLFSESASIRRAFTRLLETGRGVYGVLDFEDWAQLFWWRGEELDVQIPTAQLPLAEIEKLIGRRI